MSCEPRVVILTRSTGSGQALVRIRLLQSSRSSWFYRCAPEWQRGWHPSKRSELKPLSPKS